MLFSLFLYQLNADECQHLLMAHSVINGGVPFRDFEAQGLGPFNGFYLALFSFGNISFVTARLGSLFAELAGGIMIFLAVRRLSGIRPAIAIASPVFFYFSVFSSYTDLWEITSYNCETLFFLLLSLWFVLFAYRGSSRLVMFLEFFVLGMWPWVKLQFAPFSLICFVLSIARGIFVQEWQRGRWQRGRQCPRSTEEQALLMGLPAGMPRGCHADCALPCISGA